MRVLWFLCLSISPRPLSVSVSHFRDPLCTSFVVYFLSRGTWTPDCVSICVSEKTSVLPSDWTVMWELSTEARTAPAPIVVGRPRAVLIPTLRALISR